MNKTIKFLLVTASANLFTFFLFVLANRSFDMMKWSEDSAIFCAITLFFVTVILACIFFIEEGNKDED